MHSHSFQATKFKLHRIVNDSSGQVVVGFTILPYPVGVRNKGLITQKRNFDVQLHSFQDKKLKIHRNVNDSSGQVVEGFTILPYLRGVRNKRVNPAKRVISTCNRTVFKIRNSNFTGTSMTSRDRSWRGSQFYTTLKGSEIKG